MMKSHDMILKEKEEYQEKKTIRDKYSCVGSVCGDALYIDD